MIELSKEAALKEAAKELVVRLKATYAVLKSIHGGWKGIWAVAPDVVREVEEAGKFLKLAGPEKRELAVEVVVRLAPRWWWLPEPVLRWVAGGAIELAVKELKRRNLIH